MDIIHSTYHLLLKIPFSFFDYILLFFYIFYIFGEVKEGAKIALSHCVAVIGSFLTGVIFYVFLTKPLMSLHISKGISDALSFFTITIISYLLISRFIFYLSKKISGLFPKYISYAVSLFAGTISFLFIASFIIAVFLSFPVSPIIKSSIKSSTTGNLLLSNAQNLEYAVRKVFESTIDETLNFLTVKPDSNESIPLHFTLSNPTIDSFSEKQMLTLINKARKKNGLHALVFEEKLTIAARLHAKDMFKRGYFSHYTPEGYSPFDRITAQNIYYNTAAENLAYASHVELAFSGLMKSLGHRKNILEESFLKIGIGVLDGGIRGKMFVQKFTD